ncbi:MAG TPA: hypothetical protein VND44_01310 [Acidimicrobiales bacterium]|nr:hypothetical protein [Acidimicrobiales bacterium]
MSAPRRAGSIPRIDPTRTARLQRDAGIERARSISKGATFASLAAVAVAGVYLSQALPGRSTSTSSSTSGSVGAATPAGSPAPVSSGGSVGAGSSTASAPSAPANTPAPAYQAPVVSSGSS